jgi:hypothetical protein
VLRGVLSGIVPPERLQEIQHRVNGYPKQRTGGAVSCI